MAEKIGAANAWWLILAGVFMVAYAAVTPPFQGPDEVAHFWRSYSLARGAVLPEIEHGRPVADVPRGVRDLVATLWVDTAGKRGEEAKVGLVRLRAASRLQLFHRQLVRIAIPAFYTPVPYLPQAIACFLGDRFHLRPLVTFYLGRLFNAACALLLVGLASRFADDRWPFLAISLLPMFLYLGATFSADAATSGLACLVTALALRSEKSRRLWWLFVCCSLLLALSKPAYFLLPFLGLFRLTDRRFARAALLGAAIGIGVLISSATARRNFYVLRTDRPVSPVTQAAIVRSAPFHFVRIAARDYGLNGSAYLDQFVGRLGWLDVQLPHPLVDAMLYLVLFIGLTTPGLPLRERLLGVGIAACSLLLISLSQYLEWTPVGAQDVEGIQGRYFLPLGPLFLFLFSVTGRFKRTTTAVRALFVATAIAINITAVAMLLHRYY